MQVIGLCRFSWPGEGGFQVEHETLEDRIAYLYSDARMTDRLAQFEAITLPGLKAQTDPDFTFVVVIGDSLPEKWATRLFSLLNGLPQAQVQVHPPGPHRKVMQAAINAARRFPGDPCLQFRQDDDDAVAVDFVARLRQLASDHADLVADNRLVAFDFDKGYAARTSARGLEVAPQQLDLYGVALGMAVRGGAQQTIMNFAHKKLGQFMPVITSSEMRMFVRGHSDHNDSRQKPGVREVPLAPMDAVTAQIFRDRFAIEESDVRRVFSAL